jgi:hypothetical protein
MLWISGLLAGALFGGLLGDFLSPDNHGWFWGVLGGPMVFVCARLSLTEHDQQVKR